MSNNNFQNTIPDIGFLRLPEILEIIPVSKSTWWSGVKSGRFPKPVKLGPRTTAWSCASIREYVHSIERQNGCSYE